MLEVGGKLSALGAQFIAIPCVTAHYFYEKLESGIPVSIINGVGETVRHLKEHGVTKVGIMATDGTIQSGIFARELQKQGMEPVIPSKKRQADVMHIIFNNVKAGLPADMERFCSVALELREQGAEAIILGCTELSLVKRDNPIGSGFIDAMEVLAQQSVVRCGGKLKEAYTCLISK
jgi:aspartate racemase